MKTFYKKQKPRRVTKEHPCQICGKHDWCTVGDSVAFCMRVQSTKQCKNGAWLHTIVDKQLRQEYSNIASYATAPKIYRNWSAYMRTIRSESIAHQRFASISLGLPKEAMEAIGAVWSPRHDALAVPMYDNQYRMIGIRLRSLDGSKTSVVGSRNGLFMQARQMIGYKTIDRLVVCEGPTDTATAIVMGCVSVGKACCTAGNDMIESIVRNKHCNEVTIVSDNDEAGRMATKKLASILQRNCKVSVFIPPCKDLRDYYVKMGGYKLEGIQYES